MRFRRPTLVRLLAAALALGAGRAGRADESPVGKTVTRIVPVNNRAHAAELILGQMLGTKVGKPYDEAAVAEDVRRLLNTKWFAPGSIQIKTSVDPATGNVTVFVYVVELNNIVREVVYIGNEHLSEKELNDLTGVRKGSPLNPASNQIAAQAVENKLHEDGRYFATVRLTEGDKLTDERVVFSIVEGPVVRVQSVAFRGNRQADTGRLRAQVHLAGALFGKPTLLTSKFTPGACEIDKQKLLDYYQKLGHLEARVREEVIPAAPDLSSVHVVYHIEEGVPYTVRAVRLDGSRSQTEARMQSVTELRAGQKYDKDVVTADVARVKALLGMAGTDAHVEEALYAVPGEPGLVDVQYRVLEPGARADPVRVGTITIRGNTVTSQRVILNQLRLYPGQVLQYPLLEQAENNLKKTGLFDADDAPKIRRIPRNDDSNFEDLEVTVKETRTGTFALTGTVNSNSGLNGGVTINQRNFDISRFPTSFDDLWAGRAFRGGGQELRVEANPGTQYQRYAITFREPYLGDTPFGFTNSGYYFQRGYNEYTEFRVGDRVTFDYRLPGSQIWRVNGTSRIEDVNIKSPPAYAPPAITNYLGHNTVFGIGGGVTRDTRDSYLLPSSGSQFSASVEEVLGTYTFPIGTVEGTLYNTLFQRKDGSGKQVLAVRSQLSAEGSNAPVFERFYAGGFRSLRGFTFRGVGPYQNDLNVGGTFSFLNTIEYQIPVMANDKLYVVGFVDHGTVESTFKITDYRVSVGFGLRIAVPAFGPLPIALDFGFPVVKGPQDNTQIFSFYVGFFGGQ